MANAYMSKRRYSSETHQNPVIGFLDINFGVLGIFLIVFTIRLVVVAQPAGDSPDLIIAVYQIEANQDETGFEVYFRDTAESVRYTGDGDAIQGHLSEIISGVLATGRPVVRLLVLVPPDGFDAELNVSFGLGKIEKDLGDGFLPFISALQPVLDNEGIQTIVGDWRGELN